mmetsp:Transcript_7637/g.11394  ORF Transcript_7637/g.11394 Transcript_7637/m.11394 type:complete len:80 (+) Transcript_7637:793-1032(+)
MSRFGAIGRGIWVELSPDATEAPPLMLRTTPSIKEQCAELWMISLDSFSAELRSAAFLIREVTSKGIAFLSFASAISWC